MENKEKLKLLLSNAKALLESMQQSVATATGEAANVGKYASYRSFIRQYDAILDLAMPLLPEGVSVNKFDLKSVPTSGSLTWIQQKEYYDTVYTCAVMLRGALESAIGYAEDETRNLRDFIQANLRRAIRKAPERESEVQDAVEVLLIGRGMAKGEDFDRETGRVKVSGKEFIPDFIFPKLKLCLEVKITKSSDKTKALVDEINADILAYSIGYERQFYVVYDISSIRDEAEFKRGLERSPGVSVIVVKH